MKHKEFLTSSLNLLGVSPVLMYCFCIWANCSARCTPKTYPQFHFHAGEFQCDWVSGDNQLFFFFFWTINFLLNHWQENNGPVCSKTPSRYYFTYSQGAYHRTQDVSFWFCNKKGHENTKFSRGRLNAISISRDYQITPIHHYSVSPRLLVQCFFSKGGK